MLRGCIGCVPMYRYARKNSKCRSLFGFLAVGALSAFLVIFLSQVSFPKGMSKQEQRGVQAAVVIYFMSLAWSLWLAQVSRHIRMSASLILARANYSSLCVRSFRQIKPFFASFFIALEAIAIIELIKSQQYLSDENFESGVGLFFSGLIALIALLTDLSWFCFVGLWVHAIGGHEGTNGREGPGVFVVNPMRRGPGAAIAETASMASSEALRPMDGHQDVVFNDQSQMPQGYGGVAPESSRATPRHSQSERSGNGAIGRAARAARQARHSLQPRQQGEPAGGLTRLDTIYSISTTTSSDSSSGTSP